MEQKTQKIYPSASLWVPDLDIEQGLEKKWNDVNSSNTSIDNIKELITSFKAENHKSEKKHIIKKH